MNNSQNERRKFRRFEVYGDELIAFCSDSSAMARIKNISRDGLKFEYFPDEASSAKWQTVDIYCVRTKSFYLSGLPCKIIYDISNLAEDRNFSGSLCRICGLKYRKLPEDQRQRLDVFLNNEISKLKTDPIFCPNSSG